MMTPRQENSIERSVGRIEAQLEALAYAVKGLTDVVTVVKESAEPMRHDIAELKRRADLAAAVTEKFNALEQAIHDKKMQFKGIVVGVGIAGGAAGATAASGLKWLWAFLFGA